MSRDKQIEEMASIIHSKVNGANFDDVSDTVVALYNAGYRKQSEGEWKRVSDKYPRYVCTACNHLYNNKEYKYCPECGAKMKGENNEN